MQDYNDEFNKNFSNEQTTRLNNPSIVEELIVMKTREKLYMPLNFQDPEERLSTSPECPSLELRSLWRRKICLWSFRVADHFSLSREIVAISMSHYDRFMASLTHTRPEFVSSRLASLVSLTTLYLATKVQLRRHIPIKTFAALSAGRYSVEEITSMETEIISVLDWKLNPPTQESFVGLLLEMLPISEYVKMDIFERAQYNTEISLCDNSLTKYPASTIAYSSILLAMENTNHLYLPADLCDQFVTNVAEMIGIVHTSQDVQDARECIMQIEKQSEKHTFEYSGEVASETSLKDNGDTHTINFGGNTEATSPSDVTL